MKIELTPGKYFREGKYYSKRFDQEMEVAVALDAKVSDEYISRCVDTVESFSGKTITELCEAAKRYTLEFIELLKEDAGEDFSFEDEDLPVITEDTPAGEMMQYVQIGELLIDEPEQEGQLYFRFSGGCDWEIEHGFEAAFQDGRLVYAGAYEQVTPSRLGYYINKQGREWNYAISEK